MVIFRKSLSQISGLDWELWLGLFALNALSMLIQAGWDGFLQGRMVGGGMGKVRSRGSDIGTHISCYFIPEAFSCLYIPVQHINVALTSVPSSLWWLHLDIFFKQTIDTNLQKQPFSIFFLHF